jgi:prolyl-tRNA synthetase
MFWSKAFIPTLKEAPQEAESIAHKLMLRAGLVRMLVGGVYSYLPLGLRVLNNIENIIRQEMNLRGAEELLLPGLQPQELWDKTGRNIQMEEVMIRFTDRRGRQMCLGPTHEEVITDLAARNVNSYRQLPLILYQIQTKFRDEIRPRFGLIRACEFIMKDAYSFDVDEEGLDKNYRQMHEAYLAVFKRCNLNCVITEADPGIMGGKVSNEFMVLAESGEDTLYWCSKCNYASVIFWKKCPKCESELFERKAIEIGHIFKLGTKYSEPLEAFFVNENGMRHPIAMGCYGIGVSRMVAAIIETNHDDKGIIWPKEVAPFDVTILPLNITDKKSKETALALYNWLNLLGLKVLLDDRDERGGVKFNDADLIGIPLRIIIGVKNLKEGKIELQWRAGREIHTASVTDAANAAVQLLREEK